MIYLKKNEETQIVNIPKNGDYKGKLTYEEGFNAGYTDGLNDGREKPYTTKGFFFENGEKEFIYPVKIDRDTMLQISYLTSYSQSYVEISFYPMGNGCVLGNQNDSYIVCAMRGDFLRVLIYNNLQFELPCKQEEWHTLRLYTDRVILDGEETYFNTPYTGGSFVCACVNRGGNGFYRGLIQYIKGVEDKAVMYYISNLDEGGFKRLRSDNGVSDWYENNFVPVWGAFPVLQAKVPLNSVFINVEGGNVCPELTELNVSENGRYEGAYNVVNVDVPDTNGSYDEGYTNGRNEGYDEGYNNVINNLQLLTITENGQYIPLGKYLMLDTDDGFTMGNFTSNTVFNISFSIRGFDGVEGKNEFPILGGYPNGTWQGIKVTRNGELNIKWGGSVTNIPVTTFRKYNLTLIPNPNGNEVVIMLDGNDTTFTSSMFEFETPIYLGSVLGDGAGFDFFEAKVWSNIDEFSNLNDAEYVYSPVENGILKNGNLISNRNGGYANLVTSEGFREIYVDVPQEGGSCNLEETRWVNPHPDEIDTNGYLVYHPTDGYDGMQRIALQMDDYNAEKYNEGYEAGKAEGGGSCNIEETRWATPNPADVDEYGYLVYHKSEGYDGMDRVALDMGLYNALKYNEGYNDGKAEGGNCPELTELNVTENGTYEGAYNKVNVDVPTIQNPIEEYYYCPLIIEDANSGEYAKTWGEDNVVFNSYNGDVIRDIIYLPTSTNRNEFRTKEKVRFVQRISVPDNQIKSIEFGEFVEYYIWMGEGYNYTNLTKIVLGANMDTLKFGASDILPALNEIWDYSNTEEFEVYFPLNNVGSGGTVYFKNKNHESEWKNRLPEGWTIKYIEDIGKINVVEYGLNFAYSTFTKIPEWADFSGITNMSDMFNSCGNLTEIPLINTSNVISMERLFRYCGNLKSIPLLITSSVTNMKEMFYNCSQLTTIPALYTSKVTDMNAIFSSCGNLVSLPALDLSGININGYQAADFAGYSTLGNLTDVGGFIGLRKSITTNGWNKCPNLSYQSCINIMNGLYDFVGNSITPSSNEGQLKVHQNFLNLVGDEISIATNKGWQILA